ncbi:MAG: amidohydrolase family protein [Armatimonadetes bacterium]|nr:amidohydrolase family protein [Armatimonadota bacterium]
MAIIDVRVQIGTTPIWGTPFTEAHLIRMMDRYGVERCIISSTVANSCDSTRGNEIVKGIAGKERVRGCVVVNTQYPSEAMEDMRKYLSTSAFAALRIRPGPPGRPVTLEECDEILNAHRRFGKPVFIGAWDKDCVLAADEIAKKFTGIKFVLLSMGGEDWRTALTLAQKTLNLVLEVSGSRSPDKIKWAVDAVGSHRLVYGSNMPFDDPAATIGLVEDADITDADKKMIFEGTANRLFDWDNKTSRNREREQVTGNR